MLAVMMYRCLRGQAPRYLANHLITASDVASRLRLRSANQHQLIVPRCRLNTYGRRAFSIAGPTDCNSLCLTSSEIRRAVLTVLNSFKQSSLVFTNVTTALKVFLNDMRYTPAVYWQQFVKQTACIVQAQAQNSFLAHSKNELMQWRGVRRLSVCPSFCPSVCKLLRKSLLLQTNGRIATKLSQDGL